MSLLCLLPRLDTQLACMLCVSRSSRAAAVGAHSPISSMATMQGATGSMPFKACEHQPFTTDTQAGPTHSIPFTQVHSAHWSAHHYRGDTTEQLFNSTHILSRVRTEQNMNTQ